MGNWLEKRTTALSDLTLDVFEGESFGFLGQNGAGKTTTIKCILGLIQVRSGTVKIFGKDFTDTQARRAIGYLPEQPYFYDYLTVQEIMEMYATLAGVPRCDRHAAITRALDRVQISSRIKSSMRSLSKGLTQRVAMAQAIVADPKLLILDEPFSGLDPIGRKEFRDLLFELKGNGTTIFMSSHILSDVEFLCDRASILARGTLKGVFDLKDMSRESRGSYELLVRDGSHITESLKKICDETILQDRFARFIIGEEKKAHEALKIAVESGAHIESFQFNVEGLEELFVRLVKS